MEDPNAENCSYFVDFNENKKNLNTTLMWQERDGRYQQRLAVTKQLKHTEEKTKD